MITQEEKAAWVTALRSGQYQQGTQCLCAEGKYCCLGVLAEIQGKLVPASYRVDKKVYPTENDGNYLTSILPTSVLKQDLQSTLIDMNDVHHNSFSEIADYIEANVKPEET